MRSELEVASLAVELTNSERAAHRGAAGAIILGRHARRAPLMLAALIRQPSLCVRGRRRWPLPVVPSDAPQREEPRRLALAWSTSSAWRMWATGSSKRPATASTPKYSGSSARSERRKRPIRPDAAADRKDTPWSNWEPTGFPKPRHGPATPLGCGSDPAQLPKASRPDGRRWARSVGNGGYPASGGEGVPPIEPRMGATALPRAARLGHANVPRLHLNHGSLLDQRPSVLGNTSLMEAVRHKREDAIRPTVRRREAPTLPASHEWSVTPCAT